MAGTDRTELEGLDRETLVARATEAGIQRARILTRPELIDELLRRDPSASAATLARSRGFFGRARDLVARVVERGLHLPDAAERIRELGVLPYSVPRTDPQVMPTVTLAEIYAAQGHRARAIETLRRVLAREPEHAAARALLARLEDSAYVAPAPPLPPETDEPEAPPKDEEEAEAEVDEDEAAASLELVAREAVASPVASPEAVASAVEPEVVAERGAPKVVVAERAAPVGPECVAVPLPRERVYVHFRAGAVEVPPGASWTLRAILIEPSWDGPATRVLDAPLDPGLVQVGGGHVFSDVPARSVTRVALGWLLGGAFTPIAHSPAIELARGRGGHGRSLVVWSIEGVEPVAFEPGSAIARAIQASERAEERGISRAPAV